MPLGDETFDKTELEAFLFLNRKRSLTHLNAAETLDALGAIGAIGALNFPH